MDATPLSVGNYIAGIMDEGQLRYAVSEAGPGWFEVGEPAGAAFALQRRPRPYTRCTGRKGGRCSRGWFIQLGKEVMDPCRGENVTSCRTPMAGGMSLLLVERGGAATTGRRPMRSIVRERSSATVEVARS